MDSHVLIYQQVTISYRHYEPPTPSPNDFGKPCRLQRNVLSRFSKPPESPLIKGNACEAIDANGRTCRHQLESDAETWCRQHVRELKELKTRWERTQKDADRVETTNPEMAKQKVLKLRLAIELRRQIREKFYPRGGDTVDFLKWIMRLENDVRGLADSILSIPLKTPSVMIFITKTKHSGKSRPTSDPRGTWRR